MEDDLRHATLDLLVPLAEATAKEVHDLFGALSAADLNWKPSPDEWSVGQCLDHLIISTRIYFPILDQVIAGQHRATFMERIPVLPDKLGPMLIKALTPGSTTATKTSAALEPSASAIAPKIALTFLRIQAQLIALMQGSADPRVQRTVITSPIMPMITYRVIDMYRFTLAHQQLHVIQAQRVLEQLRAPAQPAAESPAA